MLASSSTISSLEPAPTTTHTSLLLRGTRDGDLNAALSTTTATSPSSSRTPLFTWPELLDIISSGQLSRLSRHPDDLREYFSWMSSVKSSYGSVTSFLLRERFTATYLLSKPLDMPERCFRAHFVPGKQCQILPNDWPYSVPSGVTHWVVWSCVPILHPDLLSDHPDATKAWTIIAKKGLCGTLTPHHPPHLPRIQPPNASTQDAPTLQTMLETACTDLIGFIDQHWNRDTHEIAFFANPPSLQSVPALAHFHVLVKPL